MTKIKNIQSFDTKSDAIFFYAVLLFVFLCPFVLIKGIYNYAALPQSALIQTFSILLLLLFFIKHTVMKKPVVVNKHPLNAAIFVFFAWTLIASFYAHNHYEAFSQWVQWAACILLFFLLQHIINAKDRCFTVLKVIYAAGTLTALIGIGQHLLGFDFIPQSVKPSATFANKNMAAQFITLTFPLGAALFCWSKKRTTTWIAAISASFMITFLVYTQTRAAWVAVLFELTLVAFIVLRKRFTDKDILFWNRHKTYAALTGVFLLICLANAGQDGFKWRFPTILNNFVSIFEHIPDKQPSKISSNTVLPEPKKSKNKGKVRLAIWQNTLEMVKKKPIAGYGLGNHKIYYPLFHTSVVQERVFSEKKQLSNVHNDVLQLFAETGLIGIAAALTAGLLFFKLILDTLRFNKDAVFFAALGTGTAAAGIIVNSCFSFPFEMPVPPLIFVIYLSIGLCLSRSTEGTGLKISVKWLAVLVITLMPILYYAIEYHYSNIQYDRYFLQVKIFEKHKKWNTVIALANKGYPLNPDRKKILSYAARAYIESGEYQKGIAPLQKVIKAYPYHMNALLNLGVAYSGANQHEKAIDCYNKALKIKPDFSKAHINMAGVYMKQKKYEKAVDSFQKAAVNDPKNPMILYNMGISQFHLKKYEKAADTLEKTIRIRPDWANAQLNLAILYYQYLQKENKSISHFKKALKLNPDIQNKEQIKKIIELM